MDARSGTRLVAQLAGDGWLLRGDIRPGQVTYAIDIHEIRTSLGARALSGTEARVRLLNHSIDPTQWQCQVLTLVIHDGRRIAGFLSDDGGQLVRLGLKAQT